MSTIFEIGKRKIQRDIEGIKKIQKNSTQLNRFKG